LETDIEDICKIKLSDYSGSTCTSVEAKPLDLDELIKAMDQIKEESLKLYKEELWREVSRINIRHSFANPFTFGIKASS
jgi:hypothetical protein